MIILLHNKALEPALPHMSVSAIDLVMPTYVGRHQPLHPFAQFLGPFRPHDHVKMVGHHAVGENFNGIESSTQPQEISKSLKILILVEDVSLPVATVEDVVDETISEGSGYSWHLAFGFSRLLKNAHLLRFPHPSSLQRTGKYASLLGTSGALHLDIFDQPEVNYSYTA